MSALANHRRDTFSPISSPSHPGPSAAPTSITKSEVLQSATGSNLAGVEHTMSRTTRPAVRPSPTWFARLLFPSEAPLLQHMHAPHVERGQLRGLYAMGCSSPIVTPCAITPRLVNFLSPGSAHHLAVFYAICEAR